MASQLALFGIVVGIALLLAGIGFGILAIGGALREPEDRAQLRSARRRRPSRAAPADRVSRDSSVATTKGRRRGGPCVRHSSSRPWASA